MWKFLKTEMLVILGLVESADRTDADIADLYGLKRGTVSSARRRLMEAGAMHFAYVPAFDRLGCEMVGFHHGSTDPAVRADTKANHYMEFCASTPQVFHALIGSNSVVFYSALRNATEFESLVQHHNTFFTGHRRVSRATLSHVVFPYALSKVTPIPQFASIIHNFFELDVPPPKRIQLSVQSRVPFNLESSDKRTIAAMMANPTASDREIASVAKMSRQSVARMRKEYREEGLLTRVCIPRLYRWGFEICAVAHPKFRADFGWDRRIELQPKEVAERSFYTLSKADESVANFMVAKYTQYSEELEKVLGRYHKIKAFEEEPEMILFSLDRSTELRTFDCLPVIRQLLHDEPS